MVWFEKVCVPQSLQMLYDVQFNLYFCLLFLKFLVTSHKYSILCW